MDPSAKRVSVSIFPFVLMGGLMLLIDGLALLVVNPFESAGLFVFENPNDPLDVAYFIVMLLFETAILLVVAKYLKKIFMQVIMLVAVGFLSFFIFYPLLAALFPDLWSLGISVAATVVLVTVLVKYPEWYVIDACCIISGVGSIAMLGISLNILLVIILLIGLSIYDAISVYKSKHMIDLADAVLSTKTPIMFIIPKTRNYSYIRETKSLKEQIQEGGERNAFGMGLGDVVLPGILVTSTFCNITSNGIVIALSVMAGTLIGLAALMVSVSKGKPQAGLPFLCSGAILGYFISSYILFGGLVGLTSSL